MSVTVVQTKAVNGTLPITVTLDAPPLAGNVLVAFMGGEANASISGAAAGWAGASTNDANGSGSTQYRTVEIGDGSAWVFAGSAGTDARVYLVEFSGFPAPNVEATATQADPTGTAFTTSTINTKAALAFVTACFLTTGAPAAPFAGMTELDETSITGTSLTLWAGYRELTPGTATIGATLTGSVAGHLATLTIEPATLDGRIEWDGDLVSWTISRGAGAEITSPTNPGAATLTLKNSIAAGAASDDLYNPYNAGGPYYGSLGDGLPVWVGVNNDGALTGANMRGLFGGRVTDITLLPGEGTSVSPLVEIQCEDALGWYARTPITVDHAEGRSHAELRAAGLSSAGESRTSLDAETTTMPLSNAGGSLLDLLTGINAANGTRHFIKPEDVQTDWYKYTTRNRWWRMGGTSDAALDAAADHVTGTSGWRLSADTVTNQQKVTVTPVVFTPGTFTVWEASSLPISIDQDHPYSVVVSFDDYVADSIINIASTGDVVNQVFTPFATGAKIELTVAPGDSASVNALSIEGRLARRPPSESYVADDTTSQAAPRGVRAGSEISNEFVGSLASAKGMAQHVVWRYGNPQLRPTLTVVNWFPEMFELDLFDVISFSSTQLGMTDKLFEIVGLTLEGNIASSTVKHHVVTYVLQECKVQSPTTWFTWDSSDWDTDPWAYL